MLPTKQKYKADLDFWTWSVLIGLVLIEAGKIDTTRHEHRLRKFRDSFEWSLNSIEDSLEDTYIAIIINFLKDILLR